jgi:hypothetical protein
MAASAPSQEPPDFSLVMGGPLYQMLRRAHLAPLIRNPIERVCSNSRSTFAFKRGTIVSERIALHFS